MPSLTTFAKETELPRVRRWSNAYRQVKDLQLPQDPASGFDPALLHEIERERIEVTYTEIADRWGELPFTRLSPRFWSNTFSALPMETWLKVLAASDIDRYRYVTDRAKCDHFAMGLKADTALKFRANGVVLVADYKAGHAYNGLLEAKGGALAGIPIVEPQSDGIIANPQTSRLYSLEQGDVIF